MAKDKMKDLMKEVTSSSAPSLKDSSPSPSPSPSASSNPNPNPRPPPKQQPPRPAGPSDFTPLVSSCHRQDASAGAFSSEHAVNEHLDGCLAAAAAARARAAAAAYLAGNPPAAAVEEAKKLLGNLLKEPGNDKYRKVRLGNPRIKEGGLELLEAVGFTISGQSRGLFAVMDETPDDVRLGGIRQAVLLLERSHPLAPPVDAASKESCRNGVEEQEEVKKTVDRQEADLEIAMSQIQDTNLLDSKTAPLLLFLCHYNEPEEDELDGSGSQESYGADKSDYDEDDDDIGEPNDAIFYSITKRNLQSRRLDDLEGHFYWITPQGWFLILHRDSGATSLWNPFTRQKINLPADEEEFLIENTTRCLLSHKPSDPNCIVLVVNCRDTVLWYCRPEGNRWFKHTYESGLLSDRRGAVIGGMQILTAIGGEFFTYFSGHLVVLKFMPVPTFTKFAVGDKSHLMYPYPNLDRFLLESCGELFRVDFCQDSRTKVEAIRVHRLDMAERVWLKVNSIGDRVFFVNPTYFGASLSAQKLGLKGNCIYYSRLGDKALYVYNMERGTTSVWNPGEDLLDDVSPEIMMPPT